MARSVTESCGMAGTVWLGLVRYVRVWFGAAGVQRCDLARSVVAGNGQARQARQARRGKARHGTVWSGKVRTGEVRQGRRGMDYQ